MCSSHWRAQLNDRALVFSSLPFSVLAFPPFTLDFQARNELDCVVQHWSVRRMEEQRKQNFIAGASWKQKDKNRITSSHSRDPVSFVPPPATPPSQFDEIVRRKVGFASGITIVVSVGLRSEGQDPIESLPGDPLANEA